MKVLYLWINSKVCNPFIYEKIDDLKEELSKRYIIIGNSAKIGDCAIIGDYTKIDVEV